MLRLWDNLADDLVERDITPEPTRSQVLPGFWSVVTDPDLGPTLRLSEDQLGSKLYLTASERVRELEAELARRS